MHDPQKEPFFSAPWPAVVLSGLILALYGLQSNYDTKGDLIYLFALNPAQLSLDSAYTLVTTLFLHGSWMHVIFNAVFGLAFASGVARAFGRRSGVWLFFAYYLVCGIAVGLIYSLVFADRNVFLIGASGAISGLMGAAMRLTPGGLLSFTDKRVMGMTIAWIGINLISAFVSLTPGTDGPIAWEAHIFGYLFGLLSIGLWMRLFRPYYFTQN